MAKSCVQVFYNSCFERARASGGWYDVDAMLCTSLLRSYCVNKRLASGGGAFLSDRDRAAAEARRRAGGDGEKKKKKKQAPRGG